jgi:nitrogen fixation protein NifQ
MLTGCDPASAAVEDGSSFDKHVFASILAVAAAERATVTEGVGLTGRDLAELIARWFPDARVAITIPSSHNEPAEDEEAAIVRGLLLAHRSTEGATGRWLAAMIARRAMEPNHLWEDLGLRDRSELTRLLARHFAPIATRNTNNMRWKRFFYRALCEAESLVMCKAPVCTSCSDFPICFGDESGESRTSHQQSALALNAPSVSGPDIVQAVVRNNLSHG